MLCSSTFVSCNKESGESEQTTASQTAEPQTTSGTTAEKKKENVKYYMTENIDKFKITGRYSLLSSGITWDWSASGIEFNADCEGEIRLNYTSEGPVWFRVWIDGVKQPDIYKGQNGSNSTVLASGLEKGVHTVKVARMTDVKSSKSIISSVELCGDLLERPADNSFFIEFLGDSLTCGTGNLDGWQGQTEGLGGYQYMDATRTFAYQLANDYVENCDYSFVSIAGSHIATSTKYENFLDVYKYTNYRRNTTDVWNYTRKADLVIINLGTNDSMQQLSTDEFKTNLQTLINDTRATHGENTPIVFILNMMRENYITHIWEVLANNGGEASGFYYVLLTPNTSGASSHPSGEAHDDAAEEIADFLKEKNLCNIKN